VKEKRDVAPVLHEPQHPCRARLRSEDAPPLAWIPAGWCEFKTVTDDSLEVIGHVGIPGHTYDFDVRITNRPGAIVVTLIENEGENIVAKLDQGATLNGCTLQAQRLLGGLSFSLKACDATTTEIDCSALYIPNIYIVPQ